MKTKVICFDFDYTLGDSTKAIVASINEALERLGHQKRSKEAIAKTIGYRLQEAYVMLEPEAKEENADLFADYFMEKADEVMVKDTKLYDGVLEMLFRLKEQGYHLAIVTTKHKFRIEGILEKFGAQHLIDAIIGGDCVKKEKPAPDGLHLIETRFRVKKEEILYVGDSLVDAKTAQAAEVPFLAVTTGTTTGEQFEKYPHIAIRPSVTDVFQVLS